jgi:undecaprenyl-diphosphatase
LQDQFAKPLSAVILIIINGCILLYGDHAIKSRKYRHVESRGITQSADQISSKLTLKRAAIIGVSQAGALFAGISRSGITMMGGVLSGLDREDAARFSFLLATPIILAAGLYKLPKVLSHQSSGMHMQMLVGGLCAAVAAYISVSFLDRYFKKYSYKPFGIYCILIGLAILSLGLVRGNL